VHHRSQHPWRQQNQPPIRSSNASSTNTKTKYGTTPASSRIYFNSTCKPGGTLIGVTGNATSCLEKQFSSPMGQFYSLTLLGRLGKCTTIISAYQVPKNSGSHGKTTSRQQQVLQLKKDGESNQHPQKHFCASLDHFIHNKVDAGHHIILGGDLKEEVGLHLNGITSVIAKHDLVDVMQTQLGADNETATYACGSKRIDHVVMTVDVASLVKACGGEPFNQQFFSDHKQLYVNLQLLGLLDRNLSPLASPTYRDI
jgi:hypothetical protein